MNDHSIVAVSPAPVKGSSCRTGPRADPAARIDGTRRGAAATPYRPIALRPRGALSLSGAAAPLALSSGQQAHRVTRGSCAIGVSISCANPDGVRARLPGRADAGAARRYHVQRELNRIQSNERGLCVLANILGLIKPAPRTAVRVGNVVGTVGDLLANGAIGRKTLVVEPLPRCRILSFDPGERTRAFCSSQRQGSP